jgi:hypothetical protein
LEVELESLAADLLNPPVLSLENHQVERAGQDFFLLLFHMPPVDEQQKPRPIPVGSQYRKAEDQSTSVKVESGGDEMKDWGFKTGRQTSSQTS